MNEIIFNCRLKQNIKREFLKLMYL